MIEVLVAIIIGFCVGGLIAAYQVDKEMTRLRAELDFERLQNKYKVEIK